MPNAFQLDELDGKIALVTFDVPEKKVNTLSQGVLRELAGLVGQLEQRSDLRGLLLRSSKPGQFIAGADLNDLAALSSITKEQAVGALSAGHALFSRLSRLPFPTVALIDGNCLGGGTELALSMDDRLVAATPQTQVGLPEVKIGLIPGWGGTQRLPRLIGLNPAIEMITTGESVSADKAVALGLAFDAVPADRLVEEGTRRIEYLQQSGEWKERRQQLAQPLGLDQDELMFAFAVAEGLIKSKTKGQYPAPLTALKAIREGCNLPLEEGLKAEQRAVGELFGSPILGNLIAIFFMKNRLARDPGVSDPHVTPRAVNRVGVLGAGLMGAGIAAAHARSGIRTAMVDVDDARIKDGLQRASDVVMSRIKIGRATPQDLANMLALLSTSTTEAIFAESDVVVEAVTENPAIKTEAYRKLATVLRDDAILASNTSTISITKLAQAAPHPDRFVGMHFFNPVDRMELVEVIRGEKTSDETIATIVALAKRIRKTPIVVRDCAGFLVNRVLMPYMNEALLLLQEGVSMEAIDRAATRFGMPMGPLTLTDLVGLGTACYAGKLLAGAYPDRVVTSPILEEMLRAGGADHASALRFWTSKGKHAKPEPNPAVTAIIAKHRTGDRAMDEAEITDRLFFPMLLEATRVLEEGIVREPGDVDMGLILGIGFPPFRGGILRWCDTVGAATVVDRLARFVPLGKRYEPTQSLLKLAQTGETFYPRPK
ncbi:MAG TPA: 3-hydroxyacyl-CoA dehydrogenase NAD-binding domain-containing protein [Isosphaeraceae bacterium]|nr:3-hydroxyacyl-CoA dehydrogenase NAD-binding domain-containing protein [Isosphaeraceae bacterium]